MNDLDRIAESLGDCIAELTGNTFLPPDDFHGVTVETKGYVTALVKMQRLRDWVEGLSETHKMYESQRDG